MTDQAAFSILCSKPLAAFRAVYCRLSGMCWSVFAVREIMRTIIAGHACLMARVRYQNSPQKSEADMATPSGARAPKDRANRAFTRDRRPVQVRGHLRHESGAGDRPAADKRASCWSRAALAARPGPAARDPHRRGVRAGFPAPHRVEGNTPAPPPRRGEHEGNLDDHAALATSFPSSPGRTRDEPAGRRSVFTALSEAGGAHRNHPASQGGPGGHVHHGSPTPTLTPTRSTT